MGLIAKTIRVLSYKIQDKNVTQFLITDADQYWPRGPMLSTSILAFSWKKDL